MKSKITLLVIACVLMSFAAMAASPSSLSITASSPKTFKIAYTNAEAGTVKVSIYDAANQLLFVEVLNNVASFVRPYNFSEMPEGEYTIVVNDKNGKHAEKINYASNKINSFISVSEIINEENKYVLNVTNNGTEEVWVRIFDNENAMIHEQAVEVTGSFGLIYNLNHVKTNTNSNITFEVSTSSGKFERITF